MTYTMPKSAYGSGPENPSSSWVELTNKYIKLFGLISLGIIVFCVLLIIFWSKGSHWGSWRLDQECSVPQNEFNRTWHGWVEREKYDERQHAWKERRRYVSGLKWRTTRLDYSWLFWDPGNVKEIAMREARDSTFLRFLPLWMRSYRDARLAPCSMAAEDVQSDLETGEIENIRDGYGSATIRRRRVVRGEVPIWSAASAETDRATRRQLLVMNQVEKQTPANRARPRVRSQLPGLHKRTKVSFVPREAATRCSSSPILSVPKGLQISSVAKQRFYSSPSLLQQREKDESQRDTMGLELKDSANIAVIVMKCRRSDPAYGVDSQLASWGPRQSSLFDLRDALSSYEAEGSLDGDLSSRDSSISTFPVQSLPLPGDANYRYSQPPMTGPNVESADQQLTTRYGCPKAPRALADASERRLDTLTPEVLLSLPEQSQTSSTITAQDGIPGRAFSKPVHNQSLLTNPDAHIHSPLYDSPTLPLDDESKLYASPTHCGGSQTPELEYLCSYLPRNMASLNRLTPVEKTFLSNLHLRLLHVHNDLHQPGVEDVRDDCPASLPWPLPFTRSSGRANYLNAGRALLQNFFRRTRSGPSAVRSTARHVEMDRDLRHWRRMVNKARWVSGEELVRCGLAGDGAGVEEVVDGGVGVDGCVRDCDGLDCCARDLGRVVDGGMTGDGDGLGVSCVAVGSEGNRARGGGLEGN